MPERSKRFDADSVRDEWDAAADAYAEGQATGRDYYRLEFFGPAQVALCGDVQGLRLLDVGCGTGYFAREMARRGAVVTAVDLSPGMLAHAQTLESAAPLGIRYLNGDAARLREQVDAESFDLATSCLALQDMPDIPGVLRSIHRALAPGGRLVASIAHPCSDTPFRAWAEDESGAKQWLCIDRYFDRGPLKHAWKDWLYEFATSAYHATLEDWFGWLLDAGFAVRANRCGHAGTPGPRGCRSDSVLPHVRPGANTIAMRAMLVLHKSAHGKYHTLRMHEAKPTCTRRLPIPLDWSALPSTGAFAATRRQVHACTGPVRFLPPEHPVEALYGRAIVARPANGAGGAVVPQDDVLVVGKADDFPGLKRGVDVCGSFELAHGGLRRLGLELSMTAAEPHKMTCGKPLPIDL